MAGKTQEITTVWRWLRSRAASLGPLVVLLLALSVVAAGQELPYFVTYSQHMEEPGNLEMATKNAVGKVQDGNRFLGSSMEFEYGAKAWGTTEVYLDGAAAAPDSTVVAGFRWGNRFRPLP